METCASFVAFFDTVPGWLLVGIISMALGVFIGAGFVPGQGVNQ